jgi:hypothetical protein
VASDSADAAPVSPRRGERGHGEPVGPPTDAGFIRARWIPRARREWAEKCAKIMRDHGAVEGSTVYEHQYNARNHAQGLMRLMVELKLAEKWELREHVERRGGGFTWTIEWAGPDGERKRRDRRYGYS